MSSEQSIGEPETDSWFIWVCDCPQKTHADPEQDDPVVCSRCKGELREVEVLARHEYDFDVAVPLAEQRENIARLREALEPFAGFARGGDPYESSPAAVEGGDFGGARWTEYGAGKSRDRIADWFGPSDFFAAVQAFSAGVGWEKRFCTWCGEPRPDDPQKWAIWDGKDWCPDCYVSRVEGRARQVPDHLPQPRSTKEPGEKPSLGQECPECEGTGTWTERTSLEEAGHGPCARCYGTGKIAATEEDS